MMPKDHVPEERRHLNRPVLRVEFRMPGGGPKLMRQWTIKEQIPEWTKSPPDWLLQPWRSWDHPQGPILLTGRVKKGYEDEARVAVLGTRVQGEDLGLRIVKGDTA
jgi:hypothetical protein